MRLTKKQIIAIILTILIIIFGIYTITFKNIDYKKIIDESLSNYNTSQKEKDLEPILKLLDKYKNHKDMIDYIQNYSYEKIVEWYKFLDNKYNCTFESTGDCMILKEELIALNKKLYTINNLTSKSKKTIIHPDSYNNLYNQGIQKEKDLDLIITYKEYEKEYKEEQENQFKCILATNCINCINNYCSCTYIENTKVETIICPIK